MNTFTKRLLSGIVYVVLLTVAIWFNNFYTFILFGLFLIIGTKEFYKLLKVDAALANTGFLLNLGIYIILQQLWFHSYILFALIPITILFVQALFKESIEQPFEQVAKAILPLFYLTLPLALAIRLPYITDEGFRPEILLGIFILIWSSDTFAYLVGSQIGKTKLFERISPNKTWEGTIGSAILTIALSFLLNYFWPMKAIYIWPVLALLAVTLGTIGDLVESILKRKAGVKDSGNIMPGHGGILDRLDSFIFAVPIIYLILSIL